MQLGPFEIGERLGKGGMATVWAGRHTVLGVPVALKVMSPLLADDAEYLAFFQREVRATARLSHPNVVWIFDHGELPEAFDAHPELQAGLPYLVMERCSESLRDRLRRVDGWGELAEIFLQLLDALGHAHARGVVHCDLKVDNVLWSNDPDRPGLKLCDFGIALMSGERGASRGTPSHMAPEQFQSSKSHWNIGPWSDLYAFGVLAWILLTGERPFEKGPLDQLLRHKRANQTVDFAPRIRIPRGLEDWLRCLMMADPADRFPTAADARAALLKLDRESALVQPQDAETIPLEHDPERHRQRHVAVLPGSWKSASTTVSSPILQGAGLALLGMRDPPLVGRTRHREALWEALSSTLGEATPTGRLLVGEAGVGTSAIARWLTGVARERAGLVTVWLDGQAHGDDPNEALLGQLLGVDGLDDEAQVRSRLRRLDADYGRTTAALAAWVADPPADGALRRGQALEILSSVARHRPVVVVLDRVDLRPSFQELMRRGLQSSGRVFWLATAHRPTDVDAEVVDVLQMPTEGVLTVLRELLPIAPSLAGELAEVAQGSPRIAVERMKELAGRDDLQLVDGEWELKARASMSQELEVEGFLEALRPEECRIVFLAAVFGRRVPVQAFLSAAAELEVQGTAVRMLERLGRRGWLAASGEDWRFRSPRVHEAVRRHARATLDWFTLHSAAARALEATGEPAWLIGLCLAEGGEVQEGLQRIVGDLPRIRESESRETALEVVRQALVMANTATLPLRERLHGALWWWEHELTRLLGRLEESVEIAKRALEVSKTLGWKKTATRLTIGLGRVRVQDLETALVWLKAADDLVDPGDLRMRAQIEERRGETYLQAGRMRDGVDAWSRAVDLLEPLDDGPDLARRARMLSFVLGHAGPLSEAVEMAHRAVELAREHLPADVLTALLLYGELALRADRVRDARDAYVECEAHARLSGQTFYAGLAWVNLAIIDVRLRAWTSAETHANAALQWTRDPHMRMFAELARLIVAAHRRQSGEVRRQFRALLPTLTRSERPEPDLVSMLRVLSEKTAAEHPQISGRAASLAEKQKSIVEFSLSKTEV